MRLRTLRLFERTNRTFDDFTSGHVRIKRDLADLDAAILHCLWVGSVSDADIASNASGSFYTAGVFYFSILHHVGGLPACFGAIAIVIS